MFHILSQARKMRGTNHEHKSGGYMVLMRQRQGAPAGALAQDFGDLNRPMRFLGHVGTDGRIDTATSPCAELALGP